MTLDNFNQRLYEAQQPAPNTEWKLNKLTIAVEVLGVAVAKLDQRLSDLDNGGPEANTNELSPLVWQADFDAVATDLRNFAYRIATLEQHAGATDEKFDKVTEALSTHAQASQVVIDAMLEQAQPTRYGAPIPVYEAISESVGGSGAMYSKARDALGAALATATPYQSQLMPLLEAVNRAVADLESSYAFAGELAASADEAGRADALLYFRSAANAMTKIIEDMDGA